MQTASDTAHSILASGSFTLHTRVQSWRGSTLLDGDIPIASGSQSWDITSAIPDSLTFTVPSLVDGTSHVPIDQNSALAPWGQRLLVWTGITVSGAVEWIRRDWFYITGASTEDGVITVTAQGLLGLVDEAGFAAPWLPSGTYQSVVRSLVEPALTVDFTTAPTNRNFPTGLVFEDNRLDALHEVLDTWPAKARVNCDGVLVVTPVGDSSSSVLTLTDGPGGTVDTWGAEVTRDDGVSVVIARGRTTTGADFQATAYDYDTDSGTMYGGSFNALTVLLPVTSDTLTSVPECQGLADTILARRTNIAKPHLSTTGTPYLPLEIEDAVTVTATDLGVTERLGIVEALTMPLVPTESMSVKVRLT